MILRNSFLEKEFLFVMGKGGVGKTAVAGALALAAKAQRKRVLVAMCNATERLSAMLETDNIDTSIQTILGTIDAVNMTPEAALREYGHMVLPIPALYDALFENAPVAAFFRGVPGLEAWSMLGKAYFHTTETVGDHKRYDLVILDGPATGHAIDMLRVPQVLADIAPPGRLRREADDAMKLFRDSERAGAVLVTLPEEMPVQETIDLHQTLQKDLEIPMAGLVVNGLIPPIFPPPLRDWLCTTTTTPASYSKELKSLLSVGADRATRERRQSEALQRLTQAVDLPTVSLPFLFTPTFQRTALEQLSQQL